MSELLTLPEGDQGLHVPYVASDTAAAFINDSAFMTGYFGPFGCGKTSAGAQKAHLYARAFPGAKIGIFRDTYPNLRRAEKQVKADEAGRARAAKARQAEAAEGGRGPRRVHGGHGGGTSPVGAG
jgi:hypothetical protein